MCKYDKGIKKDGKKGFNINRLNNNSTCTKKIIK